MRADKDNIKRNITIKAIEKLTVEKLTEQPGKNNISTADIRKEIEGKFELEDIDFYLILDRLLSEGFIEEIEPLKNLISTPPKNAVVSITTDGIRLVYCSLN
jgi:hypothetical protein